MALEHRDWYREKKPDWDNLPGKKPPSWLSILLFVLFFLVLGFQLQRFFSPPPVVYTPVQSSPAVKSVSAAPALMPVIKHYATYEEMCADNPSHSCPKIPLASDFLGKKGKESQLVSTVGGGYSGYVEYNGKRQSVYEPAVTSQTFKYRSVNNIKYLDVEINGVPFEVILDTGASIVALNSDVIRRLGVKNFVGQRVHSTANGKVLANHFYVFSFKLGAFEVKDVECSYSPSNSHNLLGGSFLKHFNYEINESAGTITFAAK